MRDAWVSVAPYPRRLNRDQWYAGRRAAASPGVRRVARVRADVREDGYVVDVTRPTTTGPGAHLAAREQDARWEWGLVSRLRC
ncbi:hypothetical protein AB0E69_01245 [Kribbella sp. NPDC026611]|uniref:hypothetical protein n=1 Tax=Kribbella sp. NPDC026611 TaxID=3154911 RepID=UPI0033C327C0